jgi:CRP/FNR family transcriptional regulator, cyclic AMP receptor protein
LGWENFWQDWRIVKKKRNINKFRDAIFVITDERSCPVYNTGEELKIEKYCLTPSSEKPSCLFLTQELAQIVASKESFKPISALSGNRARFDCGGCEGLIRFDFKKERGYSTLQMKLLNKTEERRRRKQIDKFFVILRNLDFFESLEDDALSDLTMLLEYRTIPENKVVFKKGDPGTHLYIVLSGKVVVIADDASIIAEIGHGQIFGEMSLLSGEPVTNSIHTHEETQVAMLSVKNFRNVLRKYPVLQLFLFKILVDRAQTMTLRSGNITSGMTGELEEISSVDLFQLINSSQKTGTIELSLPNGKAVVYFKEGEIVYANFNALHGLEAIYSLVAEKQGHFSYTRGLAEEVAGLPPIGSFMAIMMEAVQKIDEQQE